MATDRLRTILEAELKKTIEERDGYRRKSIEFKEAAEKMDKQVNRLQHFLADYGPVEVPPMRESTKHSGRGGLRVTGTKDRVFRALKEYYPQTLTHKEVCEETKDDINPHSVRSCLERLVAKGDAEKLPDLSYRMVLKVGSAV